MRRRPPLYLYRGQEYLVVNALDSALRDFEEVLRLDPKSADAHLGCAYVRLKMGELDVGTADAEKVVKGDPKLPHLWHGAARVYAQAAVLLKAEQGQEASQALIRSQYQMRALDLLRETLNRVPSLKERKTYWQEQVMHDATLNPIRNMPGFIELDAVYGR